MIDKNYIDRLEKVIKQMLVPLKDIPLNLVIESLSGKKVLPFDKQNSVHNELLGFLKKLHYKPAGK